MHPAIEDFKQGKLIIVTDHEDRENEGDLVGAAELITEQQINFMLKEGRGILCVPLTEQRLNQLQIPLMVQENTDTHQTQFTVSVDAKNTSTGVSTKDRLATIKALIDPSTQPEDLKRPGHVFPLKAANNLLEERKGHTEASLELCKQASLNQAAVFIEIMNEDGTMARNEDLKLFANKHNLKTITIEELLN
tara:strand:- start:873 stop:1448 length:576 start_codon:yes stop_codon:yes gene_type:complete